MAVSLKIWCIPPIFEYVLQIGRTSKTYVVTDFLVKQTVFYTSATRPLAIGSFWHFRIGHFLTALYLTHYDMLRNRRLKHLRVLTVTTQSYRMVRLCYEGRPGDQRV